MIVNGYLTPIVGMNVPLEFISFSLVKKQNLIKAETAGKE